MSCIPQKRKNYPLKNREIWRWQEGSNTLYIVYWQRSIFDPKFVWWKCSWSLLLQVAASNVHQHLRLSGEHPIAPGAGVDHLVLHVISLLIRALIVFHVLILVLLLHTDPLHIMDDALGKLPHLLGSVPTDEAAEAPKGVLLPHLLVVEPQEEVQVLLQLVPPGLRETALDSPPQPLDAVGVDCGGTCRWGPRSTWSGPPTSAGSPGWAASCTPSTRRCRSPRAPGQLATRSSWFSCWKNKSSKIFPQFIGISHRRPMHVDGLLGLLCHISFSRTYFPPSPLTIFPLPPIFVCLSFISVLQRWQKYWNHLAVNCFIWHAIVNVSLSWQTCFFSGLVVRGVSFCETIHQHYKSLKLTFSRTVFWRKNVLQVQSRHHQYLYFRLPHIFLRSKRLLVFFAWSKMVQPSFGLPALASYRVLSWPYWIQGPLQRPFWPSVPASWVQIIKKFHGIWLFIPKSTIKAIMAQMAPSSSWF